MRARAAAASALTSWIIFRLRRQFFCVKNRWTEAPISASADAPTSASDVAAGSAAAAAACFLRFLPLPSLASAPEASGGAAPLDCVGSAAASRNPCWESTRRKSTTESVMATARVAPPPRVFSPKARTDASSATTRDGGSAAARHGGGSESLQTRWRRSDATRSRTGLSSLFDDDAAMVRRSGKGSSSSSGDAPRLRARASRRSTMRNLKWSCC